MSKQKLLVVPAATKPARDKVKKSIELAEKRVSQVLNRLRAVGNLASPNYKLSKEQIAAMFSAIENCYAEQQARFEQPYSQPKQGFSFADYQDDIETIEHNDENP